MDAGDTERLLKHTASPRLDVWSLIGRVNTNAAGPILLVTNVWRERVDEGLWLIGTSTTDELANKAQYPSRLPEEFNQITDTGLLRHA